LEVGETLNAPGGSMGRSVQLRGYAGRADMEIGLPESPSTLQMQITLTIELIDEFHSPRISGRCPDAMQKNGRDDRMWLKCKARMYGKSISEAVRERGA